MNTSTAGNMTYDLTVAQKNPTALRPGTLVFMWQPGDRPWRDGNKPITARVQRTTVNTISGVDLRDGAEAKWDVATDLTNPARLRWTWEECAPPQRQVCPNGVEIVEAAGTLHERAQFVAGDVGTSLKVSLRNGETVHGTLTKLVMGQDAWEAEWAEVIDTPPGRDTAVHVIRVADISKVTRYRSA